jgi:hypothetical protein
MYGLYSKVTQRHYRPIDKPEPEEANFTNPTVNETIDSSVFERWRSSSEYRPPNLVDWSARHKVDIEKLIHSVRADDPEAIVSD